MEIQKLGVWTGLDALEATEAVAFTQRVEQLGFGALWMPEALGRESFSMAGGLLARTSRLVIATGIANIYARDAFAAAAAQKTLNEISGGRFWLGLGVSHVPLVEGRKHTYGKPVATMRAYLELMKSALYQAPLPAPGPTVLAALGPQMLALSAELTDGAHPYNVPPEHTAEARRILGKGKMLCVEQAAVLESDAAVARACARKFLAIYLQLPNYVNNWKRLGYTDADVAGGGSDRLIDAVVVWGSERSIRARIAAHFDAGADHVCIQALGTEGKPNLRLLELLAPAAPH